LGAAAAFFAVLGASAELIVFTIEADGFADISNAVMYILPPDRVNRSQHEIMRKVISRVRV
jgi:hypothetical protein